MALIAESRFRYPNEEHPDWTTHSNVPDGACGIPHDPESAYPDLVVLNSKMEVVKIIEIESKRDLSVDDVNRWKTYASLSPAFYLYVPLETRSKAIQVLNFHRIPYKMLGLYAYDSQGRLLVDND